jgi:hypothetical protein
MPTLRSTKKYALLGKLVELHYPSIAGTLMNESAPVEVDQSKVFGFYKTFCDTKGIGYKELSSEYDHTVERKLNRVDRGSLKRIFIASMISIYSPATYQRPGGLVVFAKGLQSTLSRAMCIHPQMIFNICHQVVAMKKVFETDVDQTVKQLLSGSA